MPDQIHQIPDANWFRQLPAPIKLSDGSVVTNLKDAAAQLFNLPRDAATNQAAERIMAAAMDHNPDMARLQAVLRLAFFMPRARDIGLQDRD